MLPGPALEDPARGLEGLVEATLDGIYVIRTSLVAKDLLAADCVRSYKALTRFERGFDTLKAADLQAPRSTTAWPTGCARTCFCVCWPAT